MNHSLSPLEKSALLQRIPFFAALPSVALNALVDAAEPLAFSAETTIYRIDDAGDSLYMLAAGSVALERPDGSHQQRRGRERGRGRSRRVTTIEAPATFGEISIFDAHPRSFNAVCVTDVQTLRLPQALVLDCLRIDANATLELVTHLGQRLRVAQIELAQLRRPQSKAAHDLFSKLNDL